jgi:WD40 repeat protein
MTDDVWNYSSIAVSHDLLAVANGNSLAIYGTQTLSLEMELESTATTEDGHYRAVSWSPDGKRLAAGYSVFDSPDNPNPANHIQIWDIERQQIIQTFPIHLRTIAWSPDSSIIAATTRAGGIVLWDVERQTSFDLYERDPREGAVMDGLAWSADAQYLIARDSYGSTVQLYTLGNEPEPIELPTRQSGEQLSWSPDSDRIAFTSHVTFEVWIFDLHNNSISQTLLGSEGNGTDLQWSTDGRLLARGTVYGLYLWDMTSDSTTPARSFNIRDENVPPFVRIAWLPDSEHLISVDFEGSIYRWDIETGCVEAALLKEWSPG